MVDCLNFLLFSRNQKSDLTKKFPLYKSILVIRFCFQLRISQVTLFKTCHAVQTNNVKENVFMGISHRTLLKFEKFRISRAVSTVQTYPRCTFSFYLGIPEAAFIMDLPAKTKNVEVIVKWDEPQSNGAPITQYTVSQRTVDDGGLPQEWIKIHVITDISVREIAVKLEKGHEYEIVVTASNRFGESLKEEKKIKKISVLGGKR